MKPKVSVVVPVFNVKPFICECLDSLASQTLREIEIITVDDGSTDGSLDVLRSYAAKDPRFAVVEQENLGAGAARNAGIMRAQGDYLFFFDADDFCKPNMLEMFYSAAVRDDADLVVAPRIIWNHQNQAIAEFKPIPQNILSMPKPFDGMAIRRQLFTVFGPQPWNKLVRREMVLAAGYRYQCIPRNNDVYFSCMSVAVAKRITAIPETGYCHRVAHGGNLQANNDSSPFAVFDAYAFLRESLEARGLFDVYQNSYCRAYFSSLEYMFRMLNGQENMSVFYGRMKDTLSELQNKVQLSDEDLVEKSKLKTLQNIKACQNVGTFLQMELRDAKAENLTLRNEVAKFRRQLDFAANDQNKVLRCCFICDNGYVVPTAVAITSLLESKNRSTVCDIYIIVADLDASNEALFKRFSAHDVRITIIRASTEGFANLHKPDGKTMCVATHAALLKFSIGELLPKLDKILYLDGDILVRQDLLPLYHTDVKNHVLAAIKDSGAVYFKQEILSRVSNYFNSGVLVLNLKKMRDEKYAERLLDAKKKSTDVSLMDQNIFNIVCDGAVKLLPIKYNCLALNLIRAYCRGNFKIHDLNAYFRSNYSSMPELINDTAIVHFASKDKPWKYHNVPFSREWVGMLKLSPCTGVSPSLEKLEARWVKTDWRAVEPCGDGLWKKIAELESKVTELAVSNAYRIGRTITWLPRQIKKLNSKGGAKSTVHRVGAVVTWPARKAWGGVKCLRDNGVKYTLKHAAGKIMRKCGSKTKQQSTDSTSKEAKN